MDPANGTRLLLVRHGHVPGIEPATFRGRSDIQLTERGFREAKSTAQWISKRWRPTIVYTSPRRRCVDTGAAIAMRCGVKTQVLPSLDDLDYGEWQARAHSDIAAECPAIFHRWQTAPQLIRFPRGESLQDLLARAADAVRVAMEVHPAQTIVMVGHDSVNRAVLIHLLDQPLSTYWKLGQAPCAISEILLTYERAVVVGINQTAHLEALE
jgi:phosphoserine phosphatase